MKNRDDPRQMQSALWGGYGREGQPKAVHDCYFQRASNDHTVAQIWAYTSDLSYASGGVIELHVNTTAETYAVVIYRDGAKQQIVFEQRGVKGVFCTTPADCSVVGCGWPVSLEIPIAAEWASGAYVVELSAVSIQGEALSYDHLFLLRPGEDAKAGRLLLVAATSTWTAYNDWGGSNHYEGLSGSSGDQFSPVLSLERPFAKGFVKLPAGAPRIPLREPPEMGDKIRYPHLQWAHDNGYSKKCASAGWASFEKHYVQWLENHQFAVDIISQSDLQYDPDIVDNYDCLTIVGHDEYWSWEMRDTVDTFVEQGGNIARFAGNFFWQIRLENQGRKQVCYKYHAKEDDPVIKTTQRHLTTLCWDAPEVGRPGAQTFGLSGSQGIYAGWGGCVPRGAGGFTIYRPDHWAFENCDLYYGDILGSASKVFAYEVDGVDYIIKGGLPFPTGSDGAPENLQILALGLATVFEADHGNNDKLYIGGDDVKHLARLTLGEVTPDTLDRCKRGSGMIALFTRKQGCIFNAGSCEWVAGLIDHDPQVEQLTKNVLNRFLGLSNAD